MSPDGDTDDPRTVLRDHGITADQLAETDEAIAAITHEKLTTHNVSEQLDVGARNQLLDAIQDALYRMVIHHGQHDAVSGDIRERYEQVADDLLTNPDIYGHSSVSLVLGAIADDCPPAAPLVGAIMDANYSQ